MTLNIRTIAENAIRANAVQVVLAHNHPSGVAFPSQNDLLITDRLLVALDSINVVLCDHIILRTKATIPFWEAGSSPGRRISCARRSMRKQKACGSWKAGCGDSRRKAECLVLE